MERSEQRVARAAHPGLAFFVLLIVSFIVSGSAEGRRSPARRRSPQWYSDNKDAAEIGAFISAVAAAFLIFFGAYLRKVLEAAEGRVRCSRSWP